jgi:outer membrane protein assembly factor BamD
LNKFSTLAHSIRSGSFYAAVLVISLLTLALAGCGKRARETTLNGVDVDWARAKSLYERERYAGAQRALRDITLNYSGSAIIDSAYFLLGRASFETGDYLVAADDFNRLLTQFPSSPLAGDAAYYQARCYFELSPHYALDQQYTLEAFDDFQRYLEDYPDHALTDSAYHYIAICREKLALKVYRAGELYYTLGEYASSVLYADVILSNYYDTRFAERAQFLKARSYMKLKDWKRARTEFEAYMQRFPDGQNVPRARQLMATAERKGGLSETP